MFPSPSQHITADTAVEPSSRYEIPTVRYVERYVGYGAEVPVAEMGDAEINELVLALRVYRSAIAEIIEARLDALRREQIARINALDRGVA